MDFITPLSALADRSSIVPLPDMRKAEDQAADFIRSFASTITSAENTALLAMTGKADPHSLVEALATAQRTVETVVTIRDRAVEAYQELIRMQI